MRILATWILCVILFIVLAIVRVYLANVYNCDLIGCKCVYFIYIIVSVSNSTGFLVSDRYLSGTLRHLLTGFLGILRLLDMKENV